MTTLPTPLVRFRGDLEEAITRDLRPRRRRLALRVAVASAAAAVAAVAVATLPGDQGERLVEPASAAERAAAALAASPRSIVHVDVRVEQRNPDGSTVAWRVESWQRTSPPYDLRQVVTGADGRPTETPTPQPATAEPFREQVLALLRAGKLTPTRSAAPGTVSFVWSDAQTRYEYTVERDTFEPVRWRFVSRATGSETTMTFETYEVLAEDDAAERAP